MSVQEQQQRVEQRKEEPKKTVMEQLGSLVVQVLRGFGRPNLSGMVRKGDVLLSGRGIGGLVGHAAIMADNYNVLEMPGGTGWKNGIPDNNRKIGISYWYEEHKSDWIILYRNKDNYVATSAADWANRKYYNSRGVSGKTEHITYRITTDVWSKNPSYCSKLVIQAYHFGTGDLDVIIDLSRLNSVIVPTQVPHYFKSPYTLYVVTKINPSLIPVDVIA